MYRIRLKAFLLQSCKLSLMQGLSIAITNAATNAIQDSRNTKEYLRVSYKDIQTQYIVYALIDIQNL